ncbi:hypothetical protein VTN31DRAFT_6940 [Thermomyces dupontii]|uniref:mitochondrial 37S ribosomal protein uS9m n=1 Tax=Talaromyces thermophilus TaxID=28565 RepID=UPI0037420241
MALQRSSRLLHHVQNFCLAGARMHSPFPIFSVTQVQQQQQTKRQVQFSTCTARRSQTDVVRAAPEIDFEKFASMPARIVPRSPAYFSGSPQYIDHRLKLEALLAKYKSLPTVPASEAPRMAWFKLEQFRNFIGERVPTKKYKDIIKILQRLSRIQPALLPDEVRDVLQQYLRRGNPYANKPSPGVVDEFGRARGKGKRKTSNAVVYLVEGNGEVLINNRNIVDIFPRVHDRESALWALRCTQRLDKYNVWARVWGGGTTGQAEAISLALARALLIHEPALKPILRRAGVITVDPRQVERKKPGHVKARKMPTWVKR